MSEPLFIRVRPNNLPKPEPQPEAGSGGSAPPEGVHRDAEPRAVCLAPDVCLTPVGSMLVPVPYQVWGKAEDAQNFATSVYFRGTPAMRFNSVFSKTYGDEPAKDKGGVKSGARGGKVEPTGHAPTVNIQGSPAMRHGDRVSLNDGNTPGEIVLSRDRSTSAPPNTYAANTGSAQPDGASGSPPNTYMAKTDPVQPDGAAGAPPNTYMANTEPAQPDAASPADGPRGVGGQFYDHSQTLQDLNAAKEKVSEWWHDPSAIGRDALAAAIWAKSVPGKVAAVPGAVADAAQNAWHWATWDHIQEAPGQVGNWGWGQAQKGWAHGRDVYRKDGLGGLAAAGAALGLEVINPVEKLKILQGGAKLLKEAGSLGRSGVGAGKGGFRVSSKGGKAHPSKPTGAFNPGTDLGGGLGIFISRQASISRKGLEMVKSHLKQFGDFPQNTAMLNRLESAMMKGEKVTGADAIFYTHELAEATKMGRGLSYEVAHAVSLQKYGVSPFSVYHPDVIRSMPGNFNSNWRKFWGIK